MEGALPKNCNSTTYSILSLVGTGGIKGFVDSAHFSCTWGKRGNTVITVRVRKESECDL